MILTSLCSEYIYEHWCLYCVDTCAFTCLYSSGQEGLDQSSVENHCTKGERHTEGEKESDSLPVADRVASHPSFPNLSIEGRAFWARPQSQANLDGWSLYCPSYQYLYGYVILLTVTTCQGHRASKTHQAASLSASRND